MPGQEIQLGESSGSAAQRQYVSLVTSTVAVKTGQADWVEVRFRVAPGFHINSHTPHDELLIPTGLQMQADPPLKVVGQAYPEGTPLRLDLGSAGAAEVLSTYQGEFRVKLQVLAAMKGDALLAGVLRYQACNAHSCFPPRSLPVSVETHAE